MAHANDHIAATHVLEISRGLLLLSGIGATVGPLSAGLLMGWFGPPNVGTPIIRLDTG
jgi:hypothetical protein